MNIPYVMKKCTKCGRWLVANTVNFYKHKRCKYGLAAECKECASKRKKLINNSVNTDASITKVCTTCGREFPATTKYFNKQKTGKYGVRAICKECGNKRRKLINNSANVDLSITQVCTKCDREFPATEKYFYKKKSGKYGLRAICKECENKQNERYRKTNKDKILKYQKQYNKANKDKIAERSKQYREANKEKIAKSKKQYYQTLQGQMARFNAHQRRRTREERQGTGITKDQWLEMMKFFDFRCAYSGEYIGGDSFNRTIDHIVPLNSGGDNMIWNMIPMLRNLNSSKSTKDMLDWYKEQSFFSEARLAKIYEWQEYARKKWKK